MKSKRRNQDNQPYDSVNKMTLCSFRDNFLFILNNEKSNKFFCFLVLCFYYNHLNSSMNFSVTHCRIVFPKTTYKNMSSQ